MRPLRIFFGRYVLPAITPDLIAQYRERRLTTPTCSPRHPYRPPSPATVRLELALLTHLFNIAIREWQLGLLQNPVNSVQVPPPSPGRERRLEKDEEARLMAALMRHRNPMLGWIVRIAIETGMRAGEIGNLCLNQVDLVRRTVQLNRTKNGSTRTVPLTKAATSALDHAIAHPGRPPSSRLVFFGPAGKDGSCRPYGFLVAWWKLKKRLGLHDLHFHDLRHEAISRLVETGLSDQQVASISGHKSMQMLKRYTHLRAEELVSVLDQRSQPDGSLRRVSSVLPHKYRALAQ